MTSNADSKRVGVRAIDVGYSNVKFTLGRKEANGASTIVTGLFPSIADPSTCKNRVAEPRPAQIWTRYL